MIGLSSYAFQWRSAEGAPERLDLRGMIDETADLGVGLFQICDQPQIEAMSNDELAALFSHASSRNVGLELGTRGIAVSHLMRYLDLAERLEVRFIRSMLHVPEHRPGREEAVELLRDAIPRFVERGVTLGLETYEQVATAELVAIVEAVDSPNLGVCLDPANSVARLEMPHEVISRTAKKVVNVHVKDFHFTRAEGWVGFSLVGCPLGTGLLPYGEMIDAVHPGENDVSLIVEHWVPPSATLEETCRTERDWTEHSVEFMRSHAPFSG